MKYDVETITPDKAKDLLKGNISNRRFRRHLATFYAGEMKKGEWDDETGEPIQFDVNGKLINGQHRLHAQIMSGTTRKYLVVRGLKPEAFAKIDIGLKRTGADTLFVEGAKSAAQISGIVRKYLMLKKGSGFGDIGGSQSRGITNHDILTEFRKRKKHWIALNDQVNDWYHEFNYALAPSDIGGFYQFLAERKNASEDASRFFSKLCGGVELKAKSPIRILRNLLIRNKHQVGKDRKLKARERAALIIITWNMFRTNQHAEGRIVWKDGKDEFPQAL